jgi:chromosome segregation ATPase
LRQVEDLKNKIVDNELKIKQLQDEIEQSRSKIRELDYEREQAHSMIEERKNKFIFTHQSILNQIEKDIENIGKFI